LTGEPPVQGAEVGEVLSKVRTGDFPTAKKLKPDVPASLDAVCKKAMALDLEDRYGSPAELAADVEAWLADEAVRAWKEPLSVRASRWIRRHRLLVSGSAIALAASVLFFAILTAVLIYKKGEMAQEQLKTQAALAAEAERRKQVREALDEMSSTMIEDLLAKQVELTPQHRSFLEKARGYYEAFAEDTGKDEETLAGVADANLRVGNIQSKLETSKDAEKSYQRAIQLYQELCSEFPDAFQYRQKLALVHNNLANVLTRQNRLDEALVSYQEALAIRKVLANDFPDKHGTRLELVITYNNLGRLLGIKGHNDETEAIHREALSVIEKLSGEHPEIPNYRFHFANTYTFLAYFLRNNGKAIPA
jgi:tetratricopeptide (TPR) repeat protein